MRAKQRKPFSSIRQKATGPLELIHTDLSGQIDPPTFDGYNYYMTILDVVVLSILILHYNMYYFHFTLQDRQALKMMHMASKSFILNDYTHFTTIYLLKYKSEAGRFL